MRYGIISDVHGNLEALNACLEALHSANVHRLVCLGDIVGYGAQPDECCDIIRNVCDTTILGNHDAMLCGLLDIESCHEAAQQAIRAAAGDSADAIVEMQMADGTLLGDNPAFIEMFANLGGKMAEHGLVGGKRASVPTMDPLTAQQRLTELMSDPDYLEALNTKTHPGHALAVKQREDLFGAMHPEGV